LDPAISAAGATLEPQVREATPLVSLALDSLAQLSLSLGEAALLVAGGALLALGALLVLYARRGHAGRLADRFDALAAEALRRNNEGFLSLAAERFRSLQERAENDLSGRHKAIEDLVQPLHETLAVYQKEARSLARERSAQSGQLASQLSTLAAETTKLATALRAPGSRGRWGELTLRRAAELAGLSEQCDFAEQVSLSGEAGVGRPDMVVRLPAGREIAVDAKAPLEAYMDAAEAQSEPERDAALARHARHVRRHVETLASRGYHAQLERSPTFVVLFLPDDGFLAGAVREDRDLVEFALGRGVVVATPATLYALLAAVAQGWREERLAESTRHVLALARELDERLANFGEHLTRMGGALGRAVDAYNGAVGSFESRLLPQARRMRELGVEGNKPLEAAPVTKAPRAPA
jgi:DNA recombination protein RmuC